MSCRRSAHVALQVQQEVHQASPPHQSHSPLAATSGPDVQMVLVQTLHIKIQMEQSATAKNITHLRFRQQSELGINLIIVQLSLPDKLASIKHTYWLKGRGHICNKRRFKYLQFNIHNLTQDLPWEIVKLHVLLSHLVGRCLHLKSTRTIQLTNYSTKSPELGAEQLITSDNEGIDKSTKLTRQKPDVMATTD